MNFKSALLLVIVFVLLNIGFFALYKGNLLNPRQPAATNQSLPIRSANTIDLPVSLDSKTVSSAAIYYYFQGNVVQKQTQTNGNTVIKLDTSESTLPEISITKDVLVTTQSGLKPQTVNDIKVGTKVIVQTSYDLRTKNWKIWAIYVQ